MTLFEFQLLSLSDQARMLHEEGVYIGKRKEGNVTMLLYQLESFYVEVFYSKYRRYIEKIRSSGSTAMLDPYLGQIDVEYLVS
jgi:hypothetical protein